MRILTRTDVASLLALPDYLQAAEDAFRALAEGRTRAPPPMHIECADGAFHAKGAWYTGTRDYVALKLNGNFPRNAELGIQFEALQDLRAATQASNLVVTCTTATQAFLDVEHIAPGTVITAVGTDNAGKSEITPRLMARARVVADVLEQCLVMGDLHHAVGAGAMSRGDVHAELAEILGGTRAGRGNAQEIFVFDSTGTAILDVTCAALAHERAVERGLGTDIALGQA